MWILIVVFMRSSVISATNSAITSFHALMLPFVFVRPGWMGGATEAPPSLASLPDRIYAPVRTLYAESIAGRQGREVLLDELAVTLGHFIGTGQVETLLVLSVDLAP